MDLASRIAPHLPYLRRFARALTGDQRLGDSQVASLLGAIIKSPALYSEDADPRIEIYRLMCSMWENFDEIPARTGSSWEEAASKRLDAITPLPRLAFLLTSMEGFSTEECAAVLEQPPEKIIEALRQFNQELNQQLATDVLIIEDEPLIALDIEDLVQDLGHRVTATARTHAQAVAAAERRKPGLILADIQLADGSSGIEAVNEILGSFDAPVIFITAYSERLLTGERPEPAFLIAKPFQPEMVKAVISQALFFNQSSRAPDGAGRKMHNRLQAT
ncbi:PhyR-type response regulator RsiB1 [soil metagenome]